MTNHIFKIIPLHYLFRSVSFKIDKYYKIIRSTVSKANNRKGHESGLPIRCMSYNAIMLPSKHSQGNPKDTRSQIGNFMFDIFRTASIVEIVSAPFLTTKNLQSIILNKYSLFYIPMHVLALHITHNYKFELQVIKRLSRTESRPRYCTHDPKQETTWCETLEVLKDSWDQEGL